MKKSFQNFILFLKKPNLLKQCKDKKLLIKDFATLFVLYFSFTVLLLSVFGLLLHFNLIKEYKRIDLLKEYGVLGAIAIVGIFAPLLEELIFRWQLRDLNGAVYFVFLSIGILITSQTGNTWLQFGIIVGALIIAALIIKILKRKSNFYAVRIWKKNYPILFYYTAIIFGLVHLGNYENLTVTDPSFVFYMASQTFGGLALGYLRIKYGLVYSILFHAFFNLFILSLAILFP